MDEMLTAAEAAGIGLINRVAPDGQAVGVAMAMAETIASRGPLAAREAKRAIDLAGDMQLDEGLARELDASERAFSSSDMLEGAQGILREERSSVHR